MSGVLDRMVQRARGELPSVEPLVRSQRTALGAGVGFAVEEVERGAPSEVVPPSDPFLAQRRASKRTGRMESVGATSLGRRTEPVLEKPKATTERPNRARSEEPRTEFAPQGQTAPSDIDSGISTAGGAVEAAAAASESASPRKHTEGGPEATKEHEARRFVETEIVTRRSALAATEEEIHESSATAPEAEREAEVLPAEAVRTIERAQHQRFQADLRAPEPAVHAHAPLKEASELTEIHITIGSIELRAPRTEPKGPPFRPRVTLDEFLTRKPGAGS